MCILAEDYLEKLKLIVEMARHPFLDEVEAMAKWLSEMDERGMG